MNVHYLNQTTRDEILEANIQDARAFFDREGLTLWDLCDCIGDLDARDAVEYLTELFNERTPAVETIVRAINQIVLALVTVPFAVVEVLERDTRMSGGLGNAIKYYGPRLADVSTHLLRAPYGGRRSPTRTQTIVTKTVATSVANTAPPYGQNPK